MTSDLEQSQYKADMRYVHLVCGLVGFALDVSGKALLHTSRGPASIAFARQIAMYLTHVCFSMSLGRVANAYSRDRSTVAHACHMIENRREDIDFDLWIHALESATQSAPPPNFAQSGFGVVDY